MENCKVLSVNISEEKGTIKKPVEFITLSAMGIERDAHAGSWHRQVSLLGIESILKMEPVVGRKLRHGEFAENITTEGLTLNLMHPLDRLVSGNLILEVTQIGKKCHGQNCVIFRETGDCVMPKEGIFCRVLRGGELRYGDILEYQPRIMEIKIITLSDRASSGTYEDKSGPLLEELTREFFTTAGRQVRFQKVILPDDPHQLETMIRDFVGVKADVIFTTGGTGIGPRDITPDVVRPMLSKEIPGIMEMIRVKYGSLFPNALVSRSIAGLIGGTLIYTLPGSPNGVKEYSQEIFKTLEHTFRMLHQIDTHG
jgi:molybdenum cofactor synthesis domain-containing protein